VNDAEAYEFYADTGNRKLTGMPRKRTGQRLTSMSSVRFAPEVIEAAGDLASREGVTVSSWIRRLVQREIDAPRMVEVAAEGVDAPLRIPADALERVTAAVMPALIRHGSVSLRIGADRPAGLIEGSGRALPSRALPSSLRPRTFSCSHLDIGNVVSASCGTCGPLAA
jgi:hypothetical protein